MFNMKKINAMLLAGFLAVSAPTAVMASDTDITTMAETLINSGIDMVADNPDTVVDVIMYAKELVDSQNFTDDDIRGAINDAADHFGVSISDTEKESLVSVVRRLLNMNLNEDELKSTVNHVEQKLKDMGVGREEVKGFAGKLMDWIKGLLQ